MDNFQDFLDKALPKCTIKKKIGENNINFIVGKKVEELRKGKGITQKELAGLCNIEQSNISRLEKGEHNIKLQLLEDIAEALGLHLKIDFVEGE